MRAQTLFPDERKAPPPEKLFRCTCGHLNLDHDHRRGQGPFRCGHLECSCIAFDWDGTPEVIREAS